MERQWVVVVVVVVRRNLAIDELNEPNEGRVDRVGGGVFDIPIFANRPNFSYVFAALTLDIHEVLFSHSVVSAVVVFEILEIGPVSLSIWQCL